MRRPDRDRTPAPRPHRRRGARTSVLAAVIASVLTVASCAPLPAPGPGLATDSGPGGSSGTGPGSATSQEAVVPDWLVPETDLDWTRCGRAAELPDGVSLQCGVSGESSVVQVSSEATPDDAAPLVVVAGPETPASVLATHFAHSGRDLVDARPLVLVDHRGRIDAAGTCLTFPEHRTLDGLADEGVDPGSPELRGDLADVSQSCTDQLQGRELDYGANGAAEDLDALRAQWRVPGLAILGIGTGARTALAYATAHPDAVSLLALDSPAPSAGDQEAAARSALSGSDTALRLWASACTRVECGPGEPDEKVEAITAALEDARGPSARIPAALLSDVIRAALADVSGASAPDASAGDVLLGDLVTARDGETPDSVRKRAEELRGSSLPYVAGCTDLSRRVPVSRVDELASEWSETAPFGSVIAAQLSACSTWPVPAPTPVQLPGAVPVLLSAGIADPVGGAAMVEPTAGLLTAAGATDVRTVTWGAPGSAVVLHSTCGRAALVDFLSDPASASESTACPS